MKKTVISTTIGAEGIRCTNGENILIADTREEFADAVFRCMESKGFCSAISTSYW